MLRRSVVAIFAAIVLTAAGGAAYQAIAGALDAHRYPEPGRAVDIGGRRIQLACTGQGGPTVVLDAGLGDLLESWQSVQPGIAAYTRVCSYDRAGYGGSDAGPMPRTSVNIAADLHETLHRAGERPPYILVGHSFGGYNLRVFNGRYPEEVAGVVLVDTPQEDQYRVFPASWGGVSNRLVTRYRSQARWAPLYIGLGIARVQLHLQDAGGRTFLILRAKYLEARASEMESMPVSSEQARAAGHIEDKPLIVLTAAKSIDTSLRNGLSEGDLAASQKIWIEELQPRLARLSARGRQIVVPDSSHDMPTDRPDAIVDAVRQLVHGTSF